MKNQALDPNEELVIVIAFDDNADGFAYIASLKGVNLPDAFPTAVEMLFTHDHVCITDPEVYSHLGEAADFHSYAPHSIIIEAGAFASDAKCKQFVNNNPNMLN